MCKSEGGSLLVRVELRGEERGRLYPIHCQHMALAHHQHVIPNPKAIKWLNFVLTIMMFYCRARYARKRIYNVCYENERLPHQQILMDPSFLWPPAGLAAQGIRMLLVVLAYQSHQWALVFHEVLWLQVHLDCHHFLTMYARTTSILDQQV